MSKLHDTIEKFRQQGFFSSLGNDASEIADKIIEKSQSSYFGDILNLENEPLYEQIVLNYDKEICWFIEDCFCYFLSDEVNPQMYVEVFNQLSHISKGLFVPKIIEAKECGYCDGRDKRVIVQYFLNDKENELVFCADGRALMPFFLEDVNETIAHTAYSFQYIIDAYGPCFIFFVSNQQKEFFEKDLGWKLYSYPNYWKDKAMYYLEKNMPENVENCFSIAIKGNNIDAITQYALFLRDENRLPEALDMLERSKAVINEQNMSFDKKSYMDFLNDEISSIKEEMQ